MSSLSSSCVDPAGNAKWLASPSGIDVRDLRRYWQNNSAVPARLLTAINAGQRRAAHGWGQEYPSPVWREWVEAS